MLRRHLARVCACVHVCARVKIGVLDMYCCEMKESTWNECMCMCVACAALNLRSVTMSTSEACKGKGKEREGNKNRASRARLLISFLLWSFGNAAAIHDEA